ncbi:MAG: BspA family leucine-rich repeat surface protein [Bacteroidales bacterium]
MRKLKGVFNTNKSYFGGLSLLLLLLFLGVGKQAFAQSPNFVKFTTSASDGTYGTGEKIDISATFDDWLGLGTSVKVRLNTGDTIDLKFDPKLAGDILDPEWGVSDKRNAVLTGHNTEYSYGVYCILELEGKGGHSENKGKFVLAGGFSNYEEYAGGHDMLVITDKNGKLLQGFGNYDTESNTERFKAETRWACETKDGGLVVVGNFTDYGGNSNYDYIVKFKWNGTKFVIDTDFMNNLTQNNTVRTADGAIPRYVDGWGKPQNAVMENSDGTLLISGAFRNVGGVSRNSIAKLNADGTVNTAFNYSATNYSNVYGTCITFDDAIPGKFWWGTALATVVGRVYILDSITGAPAVDQDGDLDLDADDYAPGPYFGVMGITVLPPQGTLDENNRQSPGGVLVTGRGTPNTSKTNPSTGNANWGWLCVAGGILALQPDLTSTPISGFDLGGTGAYGTTSLLGGWAIDGVAFMKGKMWIGTHDGQYQIGYSNPDPVTYPNYYEGGVTVLNYDGSFNSDFNYMLANTSQLTSTGRPDALFYTDGIGGYGSGGGTDIIAFYVTEDNKLMVGGSYASVMEYVDDGNGTSTSAGANPDDQFITRLSFSHAKGTYIVSSDDITPLLTIEEIISFSGSGAFGDPIGTVTMPTANDLIFENNHMIAINMPTPDNFFNTTWVLTSPGESITIPTVAGKNYNFRVYWGDGNYVEDFEVFTGTNVNCSHTYANAGTYQIRITANIDAENDDIYETGFPQIDFSTVSADMRRRIRSVDQWGKPKWESMANAFRNCDSLNVLATDAPDLSAVSSMSAMFGGCGKLVGTDAFGTWTTSNVTNMSSMFANAAIFNQDLGDWDISSLTNAEDMFVGVKLSTVNYDSLLIGWERQAEKANVKFHGGLSKYCVGGDARANLISNGWGDGVAGGNASDNVAPTTGIVDGGSEISGGSISPALTAVLQGVNSTTLTLTVAPGINVVRWEESDDADFTNPIHINNTTNTLVAQNVVDSTYYRAVVSDGVCSGGYSDVALIRLALESEPFITTWRTIGVNSVVKFYLDKSLYYNFTIDWGDLSVPEVHTVGRDSIQHTYTSPGTYRVKIIANEEGDGDGVLERGFPRSMIYKEGVYSNSEKLSTVEQWGTIRWFSMKNAFLGGTSMDVVAIDIPLLDSVRDMSGMFNHCYELVGTPVFDTWKTDSVTDMSFMFSLAKKFNQKIVSWQTGKVRNMQEMFLNAELFNQILNNWDVSSVTDMSGMFAGATSFNQDLSSWDVSKVTNMSTMFASADVFNNGGQALNWGNKTRNVSTMMHMFQDAVSFNQPINDWDVSNVTNMSGMFAGATLFNQNISSWDVSSVLLMPEMFFSASSFNNKEQPLTWGSKTANVEEMRGMFQNATSFDQNIGVWDISSLTTAADMFNGATLSVANYDSLLIGWNDQIAIGTASTSIQFHGGFSQYCIGKAARVNMIDEGWGDGVMGSSGGYTDIVDGGLAPACACDAQADYSTLIGMAGNSIRIPILDNDAAAGATSSILSHGNPPHLGSASLNATGDSIIYTIGAQDTFGIDSFQYKIADGACTDSAWVYILVSEKPDHISPFSCDVTMGETVFNFKKTTAGSNIQYGTIPVVGDLTGDGKPNILVLKNGNAFFTKAFMVFDADDLENPIGEFTFDGHIPANEYIATYGITIADFTPNDNKREIVVITSIPIGGDAPFTTNRARMHCLEITPAGDISIKWQNKIINEDDLGNVLTTITAPIVSNINSDASLEIVVYNRIYDAATGALLCKGPDYNFGSIGHAGYEIIPPAVADIDYDGIKEIALGRTVYKPSKDLQTLAVWRTVNSSDPNYAETSDNDAGHTAFVDVNGDGSMEVAVITKRNGVGYSKEVVAYVWNIESGDILWNNNYGTQNWGGSAMTISDVDADQMPELVFMVGTGNDYYNSPGIVHCYGWNGTTMAEQWQLVTNDISQSTNVSAFDFNNDGKKEIVYRDQTHLYLISDNGTNTPDILNNPGAGGSAALSGTLSEYPVIVDIDNDGNTEIVLIEDEVGFSNTAAYFAIYESATDGSWASARKVWNGFAYNPTMVNEDLTIPKYPASLLSEFGGYDKYPYNTFLQQVPYVRDMSGGDVVVIPAANLELTKVDVGAGQDSVEFTLDIYNISEDADFVASDSAVAFYCTDNSALLWVDSLPTIEAKPKNGTAALHTVSIKVPLSALNCSDSIAIHIVDKGKGIGVSMQGDCDSTNNKDTVRTYLDFGDLPSAYNMTTIADGGAAHILEDYYSTANTANLMLGAKVSSEIDGDESSSTASADSHDDAFGAGNLPPSICRSGSAYSVTVNVNNNLAKAAKVVAWIDYNGNNTFHTTEAASEIISANYSGPITLTWTFVGQVITNNDNIAMRIRISSDTVLTTSYYKGALSDGEVEDYFVEVSPTSVGGTIAPDTTELCTGTSSGELLTLSGSVGAVQWQISTAVNSGAATTFADITDSTRTELLAKNLITGNSDTTYYYYRAKVHSGVCDTVYSDTAVIIVYPSTEAGTITPDTVELCTDPSNTQELNLIGSVGSIQWQLASNTDGSTPIFTNINDSTRTQLIAKNLTTGHSDTTYYYYRAAVESGGVCDTVYSDTAIIIVYPTTIGGTIAPDTTELCTDASNEKLLTLSNSVGAVQWQLSTAVNSGAATTFADITDSTRTELIAKNLITSHSDTTYYYYRAKVHSGVCDTMYSDTAVIIVYPATEAGTITPDTVELCTDPSNTQELNLIGSVGSIQWQLASNTDGSTPIFTNINDSTRTQLIAKNLTTGHSDTTYYYYRAAVESGGVCDTVYSDTAIIIVYPTTVGGTIAPDSSELFSGTSCGVLLCLSLRVSDVLWQLSTAVNSGAATAFADITDSTRTELIA